MKIKIHPSIGIARMGNSPDEFFIGPEKPGETFSAEQPGGGDPSKFRYKDSQGRIKRQAARFRLFLYDDSGQPVKELKPGADDVVSIKWKVRLVNSKAEGPRFFPLENPPLRNDWKKENREELIIDSAGNPKELLAHKAGDPPIKEAQEAPSISGKEQGPVVLEGKFLSVPVVLGALRTDAEGRLLVLGGFGKAASPLGTPLSDAQENFADHDGWYDDASDGSVKATITFKDGSETDAIPAWVVVAMPDFAPPLHMITTLYDTLYQLALEKTLTYLDSNAPLPDPTKPSYKPSFKKEIAPILSRAVDLRWVMTPNSFKFDPKEPSGAHDSFKQVTPKPTGSPKVVKFLRDPNTLKPTEPKDVTPGADMPRIWGDRHFKGPKLAVTKTQYAIMKKWGGVPDAPGVAGVDWINDWDEPEPPAKITAEGLDRAALDSCIGGAFYPGLETGIFIRDGAVYLEPFRLHPDTEPGAITQRLALPWKYDFADCALEIEEDQQGKSRNIYWWPAQRPDIVVFDDQGTFKQDRWTRGVEFEANWMVRRWHHFGFVVKQGDIFLETERNAEPDITWPAATLKFQPVEKDFFTAVPLDFQVKSVMSITFRITDLSPGFTAPVKDVVVPASVPPEAKPARLWVQFKGAAVNGTTEGHVTVDTFQTGHEECYFETRTILLSAETKSRPSCATVLVLDRSGSMIEQVAGGKKKIEKLREAATIFVQGLREGDGVGLVQYNHQSVKEDDLLKEVVKIDAQSSPTVEGVINSPANLNPAGDTSIGAGVLLGASTLKAAVGDYPRRALLVLTDGEENFPPTIAAAKQALQNQGSFPDIYAVGIGQPADISYAALDDLTTPPEPTAEEEAAEGFLLVTGDLGDDKFRLQKYFLQILANVNASEVVLDPAGELAFGEVQRVPFDMTEADLGMDVILLSPSPRDLDFLLETPGGKIIGPQEAFEVPASKFFLGDAFSFYRLFFANESLAQERAGRWHAVLRTNLLDDKHSTPVTGASSIPYRLIVHGYSNLRFRASARREGYAPGRIALLRASLTEYGIPLAGAAKVWAEITDPRGKRSEVALKEVSPGQFEAAVSPKKEGLYALRVRAAGTTSGASLFNREQTLTAGVGHTLDRGCLPSRKGCLPGLLWRLLWPR